MKKIHLTFLMALVVFTANSQTGLYLGGEAGVKWDHFFYINSKGYSLGQYTVDGSWGGYLGYKLKSFTFEAGYYGYSTDNPDIYIDYNTAVPYKGMGVNGSSGMDSWVMPFSFGYDIPFGNDHFFVKPDVSFLIYKARGYREGPISCWGKDNLIDDFFCGEPIEDLDIPPGGSVGYVYRTQKVNTGLGVSLSLGWRIKKRADIYFKGSYNSTFTSVLYDNVAHQLNSDERVSATNTFTGNSFLFQFGFRFYFKRTKE